MCINKVNYISASRTGSYEKCLLQFYRSVVLDSHDQYSNIDSEEGEEGKEAIYDYYDPIYLSFGTSVHKTLEIFWGKDFKKTKNNLLELYRENYIESNINDKFYHELGLEMCSNYFDYIKGLAPKRKLIATELHFDFLLKGREYYTRKIIIKLLDKYKLHYVDDPTYSDDELLQILIDNNLLPRAKGTIDSIWYLGNGVYEIVDYKTSSYLPTKDEIDANLQLAMYDLALMNDPTFDKYFINGEKPKAVISTLHFLRFEGLQGVCQTEFSEEQRKYSRMYFIDTFRQMNSLNEERAKPILNSFCNWCEYTDDCPLYQEILDGNEDDENILVGSISSDDFKDNLSKIELLKNRMKILNSKVDELNSNNISYFKESGEEILQVDDKEYFLQNYSKRTLLPSTTIKILKEADRWNELDFVSLSIGKVEELCKDDPQLWRKIERKCVKVYVGNPSLKSRKIPKHKLFKEEVKGNLKKIK